MTKLFHHDKPLIGLDISQTGLKLMAIDTRKWRVYGYGSVNLDPTKLQESLLKGDDYIANGIHELMTRGIVGKLPSNQVAISIPTAKTYSRTLNLPIEASAHIEEAIRLEAEQYIPVPTSELNLDYQIIDKTDKTMSVLISATPKKILDNLVLACEQNGLQVVFAEPGISSVARLITKIEEGDLPTIIVDIGAASTDVAILNRMIQVSSGVSVGGNTFTIEISKRLHISLEEAHKIKVLEGLANGPKRAKIEKAIASNLDAICDEIEKMMRYYTDRLEMKDKIEQIIIVGGGSNVPGLGDYFTNKLLTPVRVASPWQVLNFGKLTQPSRQNKPRYISAAGLASISPKEVWS